MANPFNGSKHGKRGGNIYRASKIADRVLDARPAGVRKAHPLHLHASAPSTWDATAGAALRFQCAEEIEETRDGFLIRRRSLTESEHLEARPERLEFEQLKVRQAIKKWDGRRATYDVVFDKSPIKGAPWVPRPLFVKDDATGTAEGWTDYSRLVWKSDSTLLLRGMPDPTPKDIKRQEPRTGRIVRDEPEAAAVVDVPVIDDAEADHLNIDYTDL